MGKGREEGRITFVNLSASRHFRTTKTSLATGLYMCTGRHGHSVVVVDVRADTVSEYLL